MVPAGVRLSREPIARLRDCDRPLRAVDSRTNRGGAGRLPAGPGRFEVAWGGLTIPVWYYLPERARPDIPVLIVMHGVNRDADRYRNEWQPHAEKYGLLLLVPEFSKQNFPAEENYNQGNMFDARKQPLPRDQWSFSVIEPVFDAAKLATGNRSQRYSLYGHSAGVQFVHRFLYFVPEARVAKAVAANAGWWTLPDLTVNYPYGMRGSVLDESGLRKMLGRPLVVLLGTADTDPNHVNLRRTEKAMAQGPHRLARGQFFFAAGQASAARLGMTLGWQLATAPQVAHNDKGMAVYAVRHLFGQPAIASRDPSRVRILFGGDTSGGESYQEQYVRDGGTNVLVEKGYEYGTERLNRLLSAVDYRVINLEYSLDHTPRQPLQEQGLPALQRSGENDGAVHEIRSGGLFVGQQSHAGPRRGRDRRHARAGRCWCRLVRRRRESPRSG